MYLLKPEYEMSNFKNFKKANEAVVFDIFLKSQQKIIKEFMRSIELLMKIREKWSNNSSTQDSKLFKLLLLRESKVPYECMRRMENFDKESKSKSEDKYRKGYITSNLKEESFHKSHKK